MIINLVNIQRFIISPKLNINIDISGSCFLLTSKVIFLPFGKPEVPYIDDCQFFKNISIFIALG